MKIKAFGFFALLAVASLTLTGCWSEKLVCNMQEDTTSVDIIMKFKNDNIKYLWLKASINLAGYPDDLKKEFPQIMRESLEQSWNFGNLKNYKEKWDWDTLIITADSADYDSNKDLKLKKEDAIKLREAAWFDC